MTCTLFYSEWKTDFVAELRQLGVSGDAIGAAVAEVESHLIESGQDVNDAFGDPVDYARSLQLPRRRSQKSLFVLMMIAAIALPGMQAFVFSWHALADHRDRAALPVVSLAAALLLPLGVGSRRLLDRFTRQHKVSPERRGNMLAGLLIILLLLPFLMIFMPVRTLALPALPTLIVSAVFIIAAAILLWVQPGHNRVVYPDRPNKRDVDFILTRTIAVLIIPLVIGLALLH